MPSIREYIDPGGRILARRLDQLCLTLETLGERLRTTIATILGDTIGGVVRDTAMRVLANLTGDLPRSGLDASSPPDDLDPNDEYDWGDEHDQVDQASQAAQPMPERDRLPTALSAGLQAASWWLRRWTGQSPVMTTVAVGLLAAGIAYVGGPVAAVMFGS